MPPFFVELWDLLEAAKWLARTGWMLRGIPNAVAETVSQHSWESAVIALLITEKAKSKGVQVDPFKAATLALLHDLMEGVTGDVPKYTTALLGGLKGEIERKALSDAKLDGLLRELLEEYMGGATNEAKAAMIADSVSTYLQALRYQKAGYLKVREIADSSRSKALNLSKGTALEEVVLEVLNTIEEHEGKVTLSGQH